MARAHANPGIPSEFLFSGLRGDVVKGAGFFSPSYAHFEDLGPRARLWTCSEKGKGGVVVSMWRPQTITGENISGNGRDLSGGWTCHCPMFIVRKS